MTRKKFGMNYDIIDKIDVIAKQNKSFFEDYCYLVLPIFCRWNRLKVRSLLFHLLR